jgi:outer membrane murein-binding lipoprotein Lpp
MPAEVNDVKKIIVLAILAALALAGCASGSFLGLATTQYVDDKAKAVQDQQAAEIESLKAELAQYQAIKDQATKAIDEVKQTKKIIDDLQALAKRAEERIIAIPKEVIKELVDALQSLLDK